MYNRNRVGASWRVTRVFYESEWININDSYTTLTRLRLGGSA
jgi:hypothetical protein